MTNINNKKRTQKIQKHIIDTT